MFNKLKNAVFTRPSQPSFPLRSILIAIALQVLSLLIVYLLAFVAQVQGVTLLAWQALTIQTFVVICLSSCLSWPWWWVIIQGLFPSIFSIALYLSLSPFIYLSLFLLLMLVHVGAMVSRVPYHPTKSSVLPMLLNQLPKNQPCRFLDVGSGFGGVLLGLSKKRADCEYIGVEIAPFPWIYSLIIAKISNSKVKFMFRNFHKLDFSTFDVVYAYLSPAVMQELWEKAQREMRPGSLLISYEFGISDVDATSVLQPDKNSPPLYIWRI